MKTFLMKHFILIEIVPTHTGTHLGHVADAGDGLVVGAKEHGGVLGERRLEGLKGFVDGLKE